MSSEALKQFGVDLTTIAAPKRGEKIIIDVTANWNSSQRKLIRDTVVEWATHGSESPSETIDPEDIVVISSSADMFIASLTTPAQLLSLADKFNNVANDLIAEAKRQQSIIEAKSR